MMGRAWEIQKSMAAFPQKKYCANVKLCFVWQTVQTNTSALGKKKFSSVFET